MSRNKILSPTAMPVNEPVKNYEEVDIGNSTVNRNTIPFLTDSSQGITNRRGSEDSSPLIIQDPLLQPDSSQLINVDSIPGFPGSPIPEAGREAGTLIPVPDTIKNNALNNSARDSTRTRKKPTGIIVDSGAYRIVPKKDSGS